MSRSESTPPSDEPRRVERSSRLSTWTALLAFPLLYPVAVCARHASRMMIGRDQAVFQYVAWAIRRGAVDYRDIRDFNGPLIHALHLVFSCFGGLDPGRFRLLDLSISALAFGFLGACLPGVARSTSESPPVSKWTRLSWALAAIALLGAQYFMYIFWDIAQRESFCDWFLFTGVGTQLLALGNAGPRWSEGRRARILLAVSGASFTVCPFGKPTFVVYAAVAFVTLLLGTPPGRRKENLSAFLLGGAAAVLSMALFLLLFGDVAAFVRGYFVDGPQLYVAIWQVPAAVILARHGFPNYHLAGIAISVMLLSFLLVKALPRRALLIALLPPLSTFTVILQGKGFPYHFHPLTASIVLGIMTLAIAIAEGCGDRARASLRPTAAIVVLGLVVPIALEMPKGSPYLRDDRSKFEGLAWDAPHPDAEGFFWSLAFAPRGVAQAAAKVRAETPENEPVFLYGTEPYFFVLADRSSAAPFVVPSQINTDLLAAADPHASDAVRQKREELRLSNVRELTDDLLQRAPSACVFIDFAPFLSDANAWADFEKHAPEAASFVRAHYRETARFETVRVWTKL